MFLFHCGICQKIFVQFLSRVKGIKNVVTSFGFDLKRFGHFRS